MSGEDQSSLLQATSLNYARTRRTLEAQTVPRERGRRMGETRAASRFVVRAYHLLASQPRVRSRCFRNVPPFAAHPLSNLGVMFSHSSHVARGADLMRRRFINMRPDPPLARSSSRSQYLSLSPSPDSTWPSVSHTLYSVLRSTQTACATHGKTPRQNGTLSPSVSAPSFSP